MRTSPPKIDEAILSPAVAGNELGTEITPAEIIDSVPAHTSLPTKQDVTPPHLKSENEKHGTTSSGAGGVRASDSGGKHMGRSQSVPLPAVGETNVNWGRVDRLQKRMCCCFPFLLTLILVATTGSFLFGFNTALLNTSADYIASDMKWCGFNGYVGCTKAIWYKTILSTAVFLGAAAGAMTGGRFLKNGHRTVLLITLVVFFVGVVSSILAEGFASLLWARLIVGYGVGVTSLVTPAYISEMAPKEKRGRYGVFHQIVLVIGQLLAVFLGLAFVILPAMPQNSSEAPTPEQQAFRLSTFQR